MCRFSLISSSIFTVFCSFYTSPFLSASSGYRDYRDYKGPYSMTQPIDWMAIVDKANGGDETAQQTLADNVLDISEHFIKKIKVLEWADLVAKMKSSPTFFQFILTSMKVTHETWKIRKLCKNEKQNLLESHSNSDDPISLNIMGMCYEEGFIVKQNLEEARKFFERAANQGCMAAKINLAYLVKYGIYERISVEMDYSKVFQLYSAAVNKGCALGGYKIADSYHCYNRTSIRSNEIALPEKTLRLITAAEVVRWYHLSKILYNSQIQLKKILLPRRNPPLLNAEALQQEADNYCDTINGSISEIYAMAKQNDPQWPVRHQDVSLIQIPSQHKKLMKLHTALEPIAKILTLLTKPGFMNTNIACHFLFKKMGRLEEIFIRSFRLDFKEEKKTYTSYGKDNVRQTLVFYDLINDLGHLAPRINKFYESYQKSCQAYFEQILNLQTQGNRLIQNLTAPEDFEKVKSQYDAIRDKIKSIEEDKTYLDLKYKKKIFKVIKNLADDLPHLVDKFTSLRNHRFQEDPETSFLFQ